MALIVLLYILPLHAQAPSRLRVDPKTLTDSWYLRDASEFAGFGVSRQRLVYQPYEGARPVATLDIFARSFPADLPNDVGAWTNELIKTKGGWQFSVNPTLQRIHGLRTYRAEILADGQDDEQHYMAVLAIERDEQVLFIVLDQTRDRFLVAIPTVRRLFDVIGTRAD